LPSGDAAKIGQAILTTRPLFNTLTGFLVANICCPYSFKATGS